MQDQARPPLSKGKAREDTHWQLGWWDVVHALECTRRPLVWLKSSIIFTAHPTEPLVLGRHFPSSKHFVIPSPAPVLTSPASYEPPTLISVSSTDDWLFAYFPGRGGDGAGCIWQRDGQIDSWLVREYWDLSQGAGVVAAEWTRYQREWIATESGSSMRLPFRGPMTPLSSPLLCLVTQNHQVHVCYMPPYFPRMQILKVSLLQESSSGDTQPRDDLTHTTMGKSLCMAAAIGVTYGGAVECSSGVMPVLSDAAIEPSILVATRSQVVPPQRVYASAYTSMNLAMPLDIEEQGPSHDAPLSPEWDSWGEESTLRVCEVRISFKASQTGTFAWPLQSIPCVGHHLSDLKFIPTISDKDDRKTVLYLAATFCDFGDYAAPPMSELQLFSFSRKDSSFNWISRFEKRQPYADKVLNFVLPSPLQDSLLVGLINLGGTIPHTKRKVNGATVGSMQVLTLPELSPDDRWDTAFMMFDSAKTCRTVPANVAYSPNRGLLCSVPPSTFFDFHISVHPLPRRRYDSIENFANAFVSHTSALLISAIRSRSSSSDALHALTPSSVSIGTVADVLCYVFAVLNKESPDLSEVWTAEMLGVAGDILLAKSRHAQNEVDKDGLLARWKTIYDTCSLSACCSAFEVSREGEVYDLDDIWHLVCFSSWFMEFLGGLLRACILAGEQLSRRNSRMDGKPSSTFLYTPNFVHVSHPYCVARIHTILGHIKRLRDYVASLTAKGENAQIAKDVLVDVIDCSGIDLEQIGSLFGEILHGNHQFDGGDLERSLFNGEPHNSMIMDLQKTIASVTGSGGINRARLFIKPGELVDGINRLLLADQRVKETQRDVVTKGLLAQLTLGSVCTRCEGRSEVNPTARNSSIKWNTWGRQWSLTCICGGMWMRTM